MQNPQAAEKAERNEVERSFFGELAQSNEVRLRGADFAFKSKIGSARAAHYSALQQEQRNNSALQRAPTRTTLERSMQNPQAAEKAERNEVERSFFGELAQSNEVRLRGADFAI